MGYERGTKDFKADPLKQFLIARGCSEDRAVDLCIAGKITLKQIEYYTDCLTVLRFGRLSIDSAVDAEIIRIANRLKKGEPGKENTPQEVLCNTCAFGHAGTGGCVEHHRDIVECQEYKENVVDDSKDGGTQEQQSGGAEAEPVVYKCGVCDKEYKTMRGLEQHNKKVHEEK